MAETSERKRLSIPQADESVLTWWNLQNDVGLSVRMLIRNEIERNGYVDTAFQPVTQLPRRGRPAGAQAEEPEVVGEQVGQRTAPVAAAPVAPAPTPIPVADVPAPVQAAPSGKPNLLDSIMGG